MEISALPTVVTLFVDVPLFLNCATPVITTTITTTTEEMPLAESHSVKTEFARSEQFLARETTLQLY